MARLTLPAACLGALLLISRPARPEDPANPPVAPAPLFELGWGDAAYVSAALSLQAWAQFRYYGMAPVAPSELDRDDLWDLDRWAAGTFSEEAALASDILIAPLVAAPLAVAGWDARRAGTLWGPLLGEALLYSEALAFSSALNLLVRSLRIHPRPFHFGSDAPESERAKGEASGSFYSGHANASFLAATYLAYTYPRRHPGFEHGGWLWAGALGYAATVAGLRVAAGKHFPSDIVAGAAAGACFGWLSPRIHLRGGGIAAGAELRLLPGADGARVLVIKSF